VREWREGVSWPRARQIGYSLADQGFSVGGMFLVNIALARGQSKEEYGAFVLAYSAFTFLAGLHNAAILEAYTIHGSGRYRETFPAYARLLWRSNWVLGLGATAALVVLWCVLSWRMPQLAPRAALGMAVGCGVMLSAAFVRRTFYMRRRADLAAKFSLAFFGACAILIFFAVRMQALNGLTAFLAVALAWIFAGLVFARELPGRGASGGERFGEGVAGYWAEHWSYSRWVFVTALVFLFTTQGYYWLAAGWLSVKDVGELRAMYNLVTPVDQFFVAMSLLVLPLLSSRFAAQRMAGLLPMWKSYALGSFALTVAFTAVMNVCGKRAMHVVYAGKFDEVAPLVGTLAFLPVVMGIGNSINLALKAMEKPQAVFYAYVASGTATFAMGLPLLLHFGLRGAVYGMLASAGVYSAAQGAALLWFQARAYALPLGQGAKRDPLL